MSFQMLEKSGNVICFKKKKPDWHVDFHFMADFMACC